MSIIHCSICDQSIDTDYDVDHQVAMHPDQSKQAVKDAIETLREYANHTRLNIDLEGDDFDIFYVLKEMESWYNMELGL